MPTMTQTSLLESFDPFATHPFTNHSCIPPASSTPSHQKKSNGSPGKKSRAMGTQTPASSPRRQQRPSDDGKSMRSAATKGGVAAGTEPVFVVFEQERSRTPDLNEILTKNRAKKGEERKQFK